MKGLTALIAIFIIVVIAGILVIFIPSHTAHAPTKSETATTTLPGTSDAEPSVTSSSTLIVPESPLPNSAISSPVTITGKARGSWYFEATFPVQILDAEDNIIGQGAAQAQGDWMTDNFVPFTASITFTKPVKSGVGTIVLKKDNPSGDPAKDRQITIPVTFK